MKFVMIKVEKAINTMYFYSQLRINGAEIEAREQGDDSGSEKETLEIFHIVMILIP